MDEQGNVPRQTRDRSLCIETVETIQKILILENRPIQHGKDAFQTSWSQGLNYAFASFRLIGTVLAKIQKEKATLILVIPANIQNPILLPS